MYCTLAELKLFLKIKPDIEADDVILTSFIQSAQAIIESMTTRRFECTTPTIRYFDADEAWKLKRTIYFDDDLHSIVSVTNGDGVVVTPAEYLPFPRHSTPIYSIRLKETSNIEWTYTDSPEDAIAVLGYWAYSLTPPADIKHATIRLASFLYRQKDNATDIDRPLMSGDGTIVMPTKLPADIQAILKPYERIV